MKSFRHFQEDAAESRGALSARTSGESGNSFQSSQQAALGKKIKGVMDPLGKLAGRGAMATASGIKKAAKAGAKFGRERLTTAGKAERLQRKVDKIEKRDRDKESIERNKIKLTPQDKRLEKEAEKVQKDAQKKVDKAYYDAKLKKITKDARERADMKIRNLKQGNYDRYMDR